MRIYAKPEFDIISFEAEDVICSSDVVSSIPTTIVNGINATALPETEVSIFEY